MSYIVLAPGLTWCPDTPENWANFERLKRELQEHRASPVTDLTRALQQQEARENKRIRAARAWLPGYGPNK